MRVTLVKPPERSRLNFGGFSLTVLAAAVRDIARIRILDATDLSVDTAVKAVLRGKPELVGVTTMGFASVEPASRFLRSLREAGFAGPLIAGGHGATMLPERLVENGADAIVYGEGEQTFRELLLSGVSENVRGLFLLRNGSLLKTPARPLMRLDDLSEPARDLVRPPKDGIAMLETSRGCPHGCTFCEATRFNGRVWRGRSAENVARDVRHLVGQHAAVIIPVVDDNFTASPRRVLEICERLSDGPLPLFFLFSARSDDLLRVPGIIPSLAKVNFLYVTVGVETVDPQVAQTIQKEIPFERHKEAFSAMREAGIYTVASLIVGLPHETEEMRLGYVDAAAELADAAYFTPFQPLPGIPIGDGTGAPEPRHRSRAAEMKKEFDRHPLVLKKLLDAARKSTVRGSLARASLRRRLRMNMLDAPEASMIATQLEEVNNQLATRAEYSQDFNDLN